MKLRREIGLDLETARKAGCYFGWIAASLDVSAAFGGLMRCSVVITVEAFRACLEVRFL